MTAINGFYLTPALLPFLLVACAASAPEPSYIVLREENGYEVREYAKYIVAECEVDGEYRESLYGGFRILFDYIDGNNRKRERIDMSEPVTAEQSQKFEKIPMTAPVILKERGDAYVVAFVMPLEYTLDTLPKPANSRIRLRVVEKRKVAALRFSWYATEKRVKGKIGKLGALLARDGHKTQPPYRAAYYNPPWTLPFFRRNEILVDIE